MERPKKSLEAKIEAILFVHGEPATFKRLSTLLKMDESRVRAGLESLKHKLADESRGLDLIIHDGRAELTTSPDLSSLISQMIREEMDSKLTPASLETLAIIAYLGPCGRALIEHVRGVNSSFILRSLTVKGLIERRADPKRPNTYLYQPTFEFLSHMGLGSQEQMPDFQQYRTLVQSYFAENDRAGDDQ